MIEELIKIAFTTINERVENLEKETKNKEAIIIDLQNEIIEIKNYVKEMGIAFSNYVSANEIDEVEEYKFGK